MPSRTKFLDEHWVVLGRAVSHHVWHVQCQLHCNARHEEDGGGFYYALGLQFPTHNKSQPFPVHPSRWPHVTVEYMVTWGRPEGFFEFDVQAKALLRLQPWESFGLALLDPGRPVTSWYLRDCEVAGLVRVLRTLIETCGGTARIPSGDPHVSFRQLGN